MSGQGWRAQAEYVSDGDRRILGEDDRGDLYVPSRRDAGWWDRPFHWWNPSHWSYWLRSHRTRRVAFLSRWAGEAE